MFLTNHALTGALIGLSFDDIEIVIPLSIGSHFAMDIIPHWGMEQFDFRSGIGRLVGYADCVGALVVTVTAMAVQPQKALHILVGSAGAQLPDVFDHIPFALLHRHIWPTGHRWHNAIQKYQKPPGALIELWWGMLMSAFVFRL